MNKFGIPGHVIVAASGWASRGITALSQIIIIRLLVKNLGADQYAIFSVLYVMATWFQLADFGIGTSVQNYISERRAQGKDYRELTKLAISFMSILVIVEFMLIVACSSHLGPWLLRQFSIPRSEMRLLFVLSGALSLVAGAGQVSYKIWFGEHLGHLSTLVPAVAQALGALLAYLTISLHLKPGIIWATGAYLLPPATASAVSLLSIYTRSLTSRIERSSALSLLRRASGFGFLAVGSLLAQQIDLFAVAQFCTAREIATYAVISKIFTFLFNVYLAVLYALWPVWAEHAHRKFWGKIGRQLAASLLLGSILVSSFTLLALFKTHVILALIAPGAGLVVPSILILTFGGYYLLRVWTDTFTIMVMSFSDLFSLGIAVPIQALFSVSLQWYLIPRYQLTGAVLASVLSLAMTGAWIYPLAVARRMRGGSVHAMINVPPK